MNHRESQAYRAQLRQSAGVKCKQRPWSLCCEVKRRMPCRGGCQLQKFEGLLRMFCFLAEMQVPWGSMNDNPCPPCPVCD